MSKAAAIKAKIDALTLKYTAALEAEANQITAARLTAGALITFIFGKDKAILRGAVLGVVVPAEGAKGGTLVRVLTGEGVNTRVVSVFLSAIQSIEEEAAAE